GRLPCLQPLPRERVRGTRRSPDAGGAHPDAHAGRGRGGARPRRRRARSQGRRPRRTRPPPAALRGRTARRSLGGHLRPDSPHDYDPVWARCRELRVAPTFHSSSMSWHGRASLTSYVANHIGSFAAAGEATCRALFLAGVPRRFPELRFAFLEGGVGWACELYAGLVGHWEKRNREHLEHYDPAHLDRALLADLFRRHGAPAVTARLDRLAEGLTCLSEPDEDPATLDEFAAAGITRAEDIRDVFAERFHFGCAADDRLTAIAFDSA